MSTPASRMAAGVRSSGSTLMPPVQRMMSMPRSRSSSIAAFVCSVTSSDRRCSAIVRPNFLSFAAMTGVNVSSMRPRKTSVPVVTTPTLRSLRYGSRRRSGSVPAVRRTSSIFSRAMKSGVTRMPASFMPFLTGMFCASVAIVTSSSSLTASKRSSATWKMPSQSAMSSILPSFGAVAVICSFWQSSRRTSAASFSCISVASSSQT